MQLHHVKRLSPWIGLQWGFLAICSAQTDPESPSPANLNQEDVETLPKYQIEVLAFTYNDFDPAEEQFEQTPRGSLLDLLNPTLLETDQRIEPDRSARLLESILTLDEEAPALVPVEPDVATGWLEELPEQLPSNEPLGQDLSTLDSSQLSSTVEVEADAVEVFAEQRFSEQMPSEKRSTWHRFLNVEELELTDTYARLERLNVYTPLVHGGWVQEGLPEDKALPFELFLLGTFNPLGTIRLHVNRFLHVTIALRYQAERAVGELLGPAGIDLEEITFPPRYELNVRRRIRSGELHYFDHPAFGVLVLVRPRPEEPETLEEDLTPAA